MSSERKSANYGGFKKTKLEEKLIFLSNKVLRRSGVRFIRGFVGVPK